MTFVSKKFGDREESADASATNDSSQDLASASPEDLFKLMMSAIQGGSPAQKKAKNSNKAPGSDQPKPRENSPELEFARVIANDATIRRGDEHDHFFYRWNGAYWEPQREAKILSEAYAFLEATNPKVLTERRAQSLYDTALSFNVSPEKRLPVPPEGMGTLVPLLNAVLELLPSGILKAHQPDPRFGLTYAVRANLDWTRVDADGTYTPTQLNPDGIFAKFLSQVQPDPAMQDALGEGLGASLTTHRWQKSLWLLGPGGNGKSTILSIVESLHSKPVSFDLEDLDSQFGTESIMDASLVVVPEAPARHRRINESRLKAWISRDRVSVNRKNRPYISVMPRAFWVISMNRVLGFSDQSTGMTRRIYAIPFTQTFHGQGQVLDLDQQITSSEIEMAQVLDWLLTSASRLVKRGRFLEVNEMPSAAGETFDEIRRSNDSAFDFLQRHEVEADGKTWVDKQEVYDAYRDMCDRIGVGKVHEAEFWRRVREELRRNGAELYERRASRNAQGERPRYVQLFVAGVQPRLNVADDVKPVLKSVPALVGPPAPIGGKEDFEALLSGKTPAPKSA